MFCQKCGVEIPSGSSVCPRCGTLRDGMKFCQHCGQPIDKECVVCPKCGRQVADLRQAQPQVVINNSNNNTNTNRNANLNGNNIFAGRVGRWRNKWTALILCVLFGYFGAHKFYEGRIFVGILYLFTLGLFGIGWIVDTIILALKPNPYFVH